MASGKFTAQRNAVLDHWFGASAPSVPGTWYVALFTVAPNQSGGGTEVSGGSYARVALTNNLTNWPAASNGRKSNGVVITFPQATAGWGTVVAVAIVNTASGAFTQGAWGLLTQAVTILNGQTRYFPIGALELVES